MRIYQHCVKVIGRGRYCCLLPDLIVLLRLARHAVTAGETQSAHLQKAGGVVTSKMSRPCSLISHALIWLSSPRQDVPTKNHKGETGKIHISQGKLCHVSREVMNKRVGNTKRSDRVSGIISPFLF